MQFSRKSKVSATLLWYYDVSFWDAEYGSYLTVDMGFISAESTKYINGMYYPDWGTGTAIPIKYTWEPKQYYMSDDNSDHNSLLILNLKPTAWGVDESHFKRR